MAYKGYYFQQTSDGDSFAALCNALLQMGWELHDDISVSQKVFKSNGEGGNQPYCYIELSISSNVITPKMWLYWNNTTHVGTLLTYNGGNDSYLSVSINQAGAGLVAGNKDIVWIGLYGLSTNNRHHSVFGRVPNKFNETITTTSAAVSAGSSVSIPVISSAGFIVGQKVQIVGANYEGRETCVISTIPDSTHITIGTLVGGYAAGAFIGCPAETIFSKVTRENQLYLMSDIVSAALNACTSCLQGEIGLHYTSLNQYSIKKTLAPIVYRDTNNRPVGYTNKASGFMGFDMPTIGDIGVIINNGEMAKGGIASGGSGSMLVDTSKSWTEDSLIDRYIVITGGTGQGQARKIADNDASSITFDAALFNGAVVDGTTQYVIADEVWVHTMSVVLSSPCAIRLTDFTKPVAP